MKKGIGIIGSLRALDYESRESGAKEAKDAKGASVAQMVPDGNETMG